MLNILVSFFIAAVLGISASSYYGSEHLWQHPWVEQATWAIVGAGILSEAVCVLIGNSLCAHTKWLRLLVCHSQHCKHH